MVSGGRYDVGFEDSHLDIDVRDVADDITLVIQNWERGYAFIVHDFESRCQRFISAMHRQNGQCDVTSSALTLRQ